MSNADVVVVGAGVAGLVCARELQRAGVGVQLVEAGDDVGGRVRSDSMDGFVLDRGFQVLLTAYPEARRQLDFPALQLGHFFDGARIRRGAADSTIADPFRRPSKALSTLLSPVGTLFDKVRVARLRASVLAGGDTGFLARPELTTEQALRQYWGFSEPMIDGFFRPFIGGITLDRELGASSRMFEFVFRMFALGTAALPSGGMGAISRQLAQRIPVLLGRRATAVTARSVTLEDGEVLHGSAVVVATSGAVASRLVPGLGPVKQRRVHCLYYATPEPPVSEPVLVLNGDGTGPINNLCVPSLVANGYAPAGQHLLSVVVLEGHGLADSELNSAVLRQLREWYGPVVDTYRLLRRYDIEDALPDQRPPFLTEAEPAPAVDGVWLAGDYRGTASLNGAMASGRRVAEAILARESSRAA